MVEFCRGKKLHPFCWVVGAKDVKIHLKFLIGLFCLSIGLRVIGCGQANVVFEEASEFLGKGGGKLGALIRDESIV